MRRGPGLLAIAALVTASCGGGGGGGSPPPPPPPVPPPPPPAATRLYDVPAALALSQVEVQQIIAQGVAEAQARALPATFAVVDRVGNVLAVFAMTGANPRLQVRAAPTAASTISRGWTCPARSPERSPRRSPAPISRRAATLSRPGPRA